MPKSYKILEVESFPEFNNDKKFIIKHQLALFDTIRDVDIFLIREDEDYLNTGFRKIKIHHEILRNQIGRLENGEIFKQFISLHDFPGYFDYKLNFLLLSTKKEIANNFVKVFNLKSEYEFKEFSIDFVKMKPKISEIFAAWFKINNLPNISAIGTYGFNVDKSIQFQEAEGQGSITALSLDYIHDQRINKIQITKDGAVVLFQNYEDVSYEIKMIREIKNNLIDPCKINIPAETNDEFENIVQYEKEF